MAELAAALGVEPVLEAVVPCLDADGKPSADPSILKRDMAAIRDAAAAEYPSPASPSPPPAT